MTRTTEDPGTTAPVADRSPLDRAIERVVREGNCSGCGACTLLDDGLVMGMDAAGFNRPTRVSAATGAAQPDPAAAVRAFERSCPGVRVDAQRPAGSTRHPTMGPIVQAWEAWATDPAIRYAGSSGGTLTALAAWLTETGQASRVVGATSDAANPRRSVSVSITTREQALASAGSRYAPVSACAAPGVREPGTAVIGKPCEVSALRALGSVPSDTGATSAGAGLTNDPLLLSFYCAGTPSQNATDGLLAELGVPQEQQLASLRYRGNGWPGKFAAATADHATVSASYDESWGAHLGRAVQWRCKVCADGVGESSDVTAADLWRADERGYPVFTDGAGVSALIARTARGQKVVLDAIAAGVLEARPVAITELAAVQPLQNARRQTLLARLIGTRIAGGRVPTYRGFGLVRLTLPRLRESLRVARATARRRRGWRTP